MSSILSRLGLSSGLSSSEKEQNRMNLAEQVRAAGLGDVNPNVFKGISFADARNLTLKLSGLKQKREAKGEEKEQNIGNILKLISSRTPEEQVRKGFIGPKTERVAEFSPEQLRGAKSTAPVIDIPFLRGKTEAEKRAFISTPTGREAFKSFVLGGVEQPKPLPPSDITLKAAQAAKAIGATSKLAAETKQIGKLPIKEQSKREAIRLGLNILTLTKKNISFIKDPETIQQAREIASILPVKTPVGREIRDVFGFPGQVLKTLTENELLRNEKLSIQIKNLKKEPIPENFFDLAREHSAILFPDDKQKQFDFIENVTKNKSSQTSIRSKAVDGRSQLQLIRKIRIAFAEHPEYVGFLDNLWGKFAARTIGLSQAEADFRANVKLLVIGLRRFYFGTAQTKQELSGNLEAIPDTFLTENSLIAALNANEGLITSKLDILGTQSFGQIDLSGIEENQEQERISNLSDEEFRQEFGN